MHACGKGGRATSTCLFGAASQPSSPSTDRYMTRSGVWPMVFSPNSRGGMALNETTLPALLKTVGYDTFMAGKVGQTPPFSQPMSSTWSCTRAVAPRRRQRRGVPAAQPGLRPLLRSAVRHRHVCSGARATHHPRWRAGRSLLRAQRVVRGGPGRGRARQWCRPRVRDAVSVLRQQHHHPATHAIAINRR